MTTPDDPDMPGPDMTAAELALGVLDGEERAAALRRVLAEPGFAREVEWWRAHLSALHVDVAAVEPGRAARQRAMRIPDRAAPWGRYGAWAAGAGALAAAALFAVLLTRPASLSLPVPVPAARPAPSLVAVLRPDTGEPFSAVLDPARREVRWSGKLPVPAGRDAELWAIGADGVPRALAVLRQGASSFRPVTRLPVALGRTLAAGTTLAISIEPAGGSPAAGPTGPVVATGRIVAI